MFTLIDRNTLDRITKRRLSFAALLISLLVLFPPGHGVAGRSLYYDVARDLDRLPALCKFKTAENMRSSARTDPSGSPEERMANEWGHRQYGDAWWAMHHYCWGLIDSFRAAEAIGKSGESGEKSALRMAIKNFMFVVDNAKPPYTKEYLKLEAQLYYRVGRAHERLGEPAEAGVAYTKAIQRRPDYEQAYAALSDLFRNLDQDEEARKILTDGLEQVPDSSMLKRRVADLSAKAKVE